MQDTCVLQPRTTGAADNYNLPTETWPDGSSYACGLKPRDRDEAMDAAEVPLVDARLRLPLSAEASLSNVDRIKITRRFGVTLSTPISYEIVGPPRRGPSGLVLDLKQVTDGS